MRNRLLSVVLVLGFGCSSKSAGNDGSPPEEVDGVELFGKLAGLWSGSSTSTPLGDFPLKNMDFRPAGDSVLFGRVDLDAQNALRFAFDVENHGGEDVLIFRNGGLFEGLSRDTRSRLVDSDESSYHFCALEGGCEYLDATFTFASETALEMRVLVRGELHELWTPTRVESRTVPASFPAHTLAADSGFPPLPSVDIDVSWSQEFEDSTDVWAVLSTSSCIPSGDCHPSRWIKATAESGATTASIKFDQVHTGEYFVLGMVDANGNLASLGLPDPGDMVSVPSPGLTVTAEGDNAVQVSASFDL